MVRLKCTSQGCSALGLHDALPVRVPAEASTADRAARAHADLDVLQAEAVARGGGGEVARLPWYSVRSAVRTAVI